MATKKTKCFQVPSHWTLVQRLAHYSEQVASGCRLWSGPINYNGYGHLSWDGKVQRTHRLAWIAKNGPIPNGMYVCHRCDVRHCVNVDHLFLGTAADNMADKMSKGRGGQPHGEGAGGAKLTDKLAMEIFLAPGSHHSIAARFGVGHSTVGAIKIKKTWRHIHDGGSPAAAIAWS